MYCLISCCICYIILFMNNALEKIIKFTYYKNRIIATIGLMIGLFNPLLGFPIVLLAYYYQRRQLIKVHKDEKLFSLIALVLMAAFLIIYLITLVQTLGQIDETIGSSLLKLL